MRSLVNLLMIYTIVILIEANFKTKNNKIYFTKKTIDQIRFVFLSKRTFTHLRKLKIPHFFTVKGTCALVLSV